LWGSEDRVRVARLASFSRGRSRSKAIDLDKIDKDFVFPIRVLEFIRPTWNDWRPHDAVWRTLLVVWLQLEKNYLPKPLERGGELLNNVTVQDISDRSPEVAAETLIKLNKDYPKTVQRILVFLHKEQSRLSQETFDELYVPH
jgi:pentatricopeptide repeat-containing protein PET309